MLREIVEGADWGEDAELTFSKIMKIVDDINSKISSAKLDARTYQTLEKAKQELEKALRRM